MKFTTLIALVGLAQATKLRQKSSIEGAISSAISNSNKATTEADSEARTKARTEANIKATVKALGGRVNWRSAREIMDTFDVDANGTIFQRNEFKRTLARICDALPYEENPCFDEGVEFFFEMRGMDENDARDGVQLDEVIAWIGKMRQKQIDEVMEVARGHNDNMDVELQKKKTELDAATADFVAWKHEWNMAH